MKQALARAMVLLTLASAWAQEPVGPARTVRLTPREDGFHKAVPESASGRNLAYGYTFQTEPELPEEDVVRTLLILSRQEGRQPNKLESIGLLWDMQRFVVYVDANRNRDLTDDGPPCPAVYRSRSFWEASDVRLNIAEPEGASRPYRVDLRLMRWSRDYYVCEAVVHSGWEGQVLLGGETWNVGLAGNLDEKLDALDSLLLHRDKGYAVDPEVRQAMYALPASPRLCINGKTYDLTYAFDGPDVLVTFQEVSASTGSLQIVGGQSVERIVLHGVHEAIWDTPRGTVPVLTGTYAEFEVFLYDPGSGACFRQHGERGLSILPKRPAERLHCGEPLENRVQIIRDGPRLLFFHETKWADGEAYSRIDKPAGLGPGERRDPPTFTVLCDGEQVASGRFEYG